jgi:hypothetical protein
MIEDDEIPEVFEEDHGAELDDEMKLLLGKLDEDPLAVTDKMEGVIPTSQGRPLDTSPPLNLIANTEVTTSKLPDVETLKPADVRRVGMTPVAKLDATPAPIAEPPIVDVRKQFEQMDHVVDEILQGVRADRQEAQDTITLIRNEIDKAIHGGHNPSRMYVDNLVKALEVKTTINMTAVKAMEAKAKLLAATKAGIVVQNNNQVNNANLQGGTDQNLMDVLANPIGEDDEY